MRQGIGTSAGRPDGRLKVTGQFAYSSDLWVEGMLWGVTIRSPHPAARIRSVDVDGALATTGVSAVLTHADIPGRPLYGMRKPDQPVLARGEVRYEGEPVALVAAYEPLTARIAAERVLVSYEVLDPVTSAEQAFAPGTRRVNDGGNLVRHVVIDSGDVEKARQRADTIVQGTYQVGMQDQAFLGPESGLAIPSADGSVDLYVATQWLHNDRNQVAASLGLPLEKVRVTLAGVGGSFGGREDLSMQIHACMLALRTGRPVKMVYSRDESFIGHVHRHPARMTYEHGATRDGLLTHVHARVVFDGGAYESTSAEVCDVAASCATGPYRVDNAHVDVLAAFTNNPPCGAMRGFGAVQVCFGYESQMDKLAAALGLHPVELRQRNAIRTGDLFPSQQVLDTPAPVGELLERLMRMPLPAPPSEDERQDPRLRPGGVSNTTRPSDVVRGVGYAVGVKTIAIGHGYPERSTARVRLSVSGDEPLVEVYTAACEVGQGSTTVFGQIARTELSLESVVVMPADTDSGDTGPSSASRQTWITGGAVKLACEAVRDELFARAAGLVDVGTGELICRDGWIKRAGGDESLVSVVEAIGDAPIDAEREFRMRPTVPLDASGHGNANISWGFAAHRAVVDVDLELGLVRVVEIATSQDVGRAMNPLAVEGQIEGGIAQGLGLALMEEIQVSGGKIRNPSFTDYLIPTILDMPPVRSEILELPQPHSPYGLNGIGEPPVVASPAAVAAAVRAATGCELPRIPIRPHDIVAASARLGAEAVR